MSLKVHIVGGGDGHFEVWLDTEIAAQDGLCIGTGPTVPLAIHDARQSLAVAGFALERATYFGVQPADVVRAQGVLELPVIGR